MRLTTGRIKKLKFTRSVSETTKFENESFVDYVNYYGVGSSYDASAEWRDKKLEDRIAGLFKQTIQLSHLNAANLHPKDVLIQKQAEEARKRLGDRLADMKHSDPEKFAVIYEMLYSDFHGVREEEAKAVTSGKAPGTLTPPWVGGKGILWKSFYDDHLREMQADMMQSDEVEDVIYEDGTTFHENREHALPYRGPDAEKIYEKYPWLQVMKEKGEKLDQLEDPVAQLEENQKKGEKILHFLF